MNVFLGIHVKRTTLRKGRLRGTGTAQWAIASNDSRLIMGGRCYVFCSKAFGRNGHRPITIFKANWTPRFVQQFSPDTSGRLGGCYSCMQLPV